jgi:hypothetical protein
MAIKVTKDNRTILTGVHYSRFRRKLYEDQDRLCIRCGRCCNLTVDLMAENSFHVLHRGSRGMGSAIRDDVVGQKRGQVEGGGCAKCHRQDHQKKAITGEMS